MKECTFKPQRITEKGDFNRSVMSNTHNQSTMTALTKAKYE